MQKTPIPPKNGKYRCLYYARNPSAPYTTATMPEDDYLQTDIWRAIRNRRIRMDCYQCQMCGTAKNLHVHHIRYPDVWGTENVEDDLITLCDSCHAKVHEIDIHNE